MAKISVLGLDVAVLRAADVDAHAVLGEGIEGDPAVRNRLSCAPDADAPRAGPHPHFLLLLVPEGVVVADARKQPAHVAHVQPFDAGDALQQVSPEFTQGIAVGGRQAHARDDDPRKVRWSAQGGKSLAISAGNAIKGSYP